MGVPAGFPKSSRTSAHLKLVLYYRLIAEWERREGRKSVLSLLKLRTLSLLGGVDRGHQGRVLPSTPTSRPLAELEWVFLPPAETSPPCLGCARCDVRNCGPLSTGCDCSCQGIRPQSFARAAQAGDYGVTCEMYVAQLAKNVRSTPEMYSTPIHTFPEGSDTAAV